MNESPPLFRRLIGRLRCLLLRNASGFIGLALLMPSMSFAIIGGEGVDSNTIVSIWGGVGSVLTGSSGAYSGALIAPNYVITAAHVVAGTVGNPSYVKFQINAGDTTQISASEIFVHPGYTGKPGPDRLMHHDIAIVRLSSNAPAGVPYYSLYTAEVMAGTIFKLVGYGLGGDGLTGATVPNSASVKRTGQNRVDLLLPRLAPGVSGHDAYVFDFDGPNSATNVYGPAVPATATLGADVEATVGGGDSGSPAFVMDDGEWKLAGVNTFTGGVPGLGAAGFFGSIGGGMLISAYAPWIESVLTAAPKPPAPAAHQ